MEEILEHMKKEAIRELQILANARFDDERAAFYKAKYELIKMLNPVQFREVQEHLIALTEYPDKLLSLIASRSRCESLIAQIEHLIKLQKWETIPTEAGGMTVEELQKEAEVCFAGEGGGRKR